MARIQRPRPDRSFADPAAFALGVSLAYWAAIAQIGAILRAKEPPIEQRFSQKAYRRHFRRLRRDAWRTYA